MKAILISVNPKHCYNIIKGLKTEELRKSFPKIDLPATVFIYCTLNKQDGFETCYGNPHSPKVMNGKVIAKFTLEKFEPVYNFYLKEICALACLTEQELLKYAGGTYDKVDDLYAWHISNLEVFEEPIELNRFYKYGAQAQYEHDEKVFTEKQAKLFMNKFLRIERAPQSYCYCEDFYE